MSKATLDTDGRPLQEPAIVRIGQPTRVIDVIAPIGGWTWFPEGTNALVQFIAHTFFYGTVLGIYLNSAARRS
ncbi:MAG: hypothetical protein ACRDG7_16090 [Candidatus Limnocylindria bacterium]